jgi:hypothetical protein
MAVFLHVQKTSRPTAASLRAGVCAFSVVAPMNDPGLLRTMAAAVDLHTQFKRARAPEPPPDAVPHYLLNKRAPSQPKEPPMASFSDLIASAHALLMSKRSPTSDELATALDCLNRADAMIEKAKARTAVSDDEDDFESPSDPANDYDGDGGDDGDDEEDNGARRRVKKADYSYSLPHYGSTPSPQTASGHGTGPNQSADPYATGSWSTAGTPSKTAFDDKVQEIQQRDGIAPHLAMSRARLEAPKLYMDHQASLVAGPTRDSHARRSSGQATKAAPPTFWEDCVSAELRKGASTVEVASQRAAQQFGYDAFNNRMLAKGSQDIEARFRKIVKSLSYEQDISLEEATRLARKRNPHLYRALNSV